MSFHPFLESSAALSASSATPRFDDSIQNPKSKISPLRLCGKSSSESGGSLAHPRFIGKNFDRFAAGLWDLRVA
jgi:hypothetical protein